MALAHAAAGEIVSLTPLGDAVDTTKTHALVKTQDFEAIRLVMPKGAEFPAHQVEGMITLQCLEGSIELTAGETMEMVAGDWIYLDRGKAHSLRALSDASLLLTILF